MSQLLRQSDPVTFEVVRNALYAICEEMKAVMMRASFSPLLSLSADLSCALLDASGEVVAQGNDIPVHLGAMPFTARGVLSRLPAESWRPGDAALTNDPYLGNNHLPDMTLLTAIHDDRGLLGFSASRVHWPDIGGIAAGSSSVTDHILKEGVRVPPTKVVREGRVDEGVMGLLLANVRVPEDRMGDFRAQVACNRRGLERLAELSRRYGGDVLRRVFAETQDYSEFQVRAVLRALPDGRWTAEDWLDGDGFEEGPPERFTIRVAIEKRGEAIEADFAGSAPAVRGPINAPFAVTASSCYYVLMALAGGSVPPNSGAYRPMAVRAPAGSIVHAQYPSPVVSANTETSSRIADLLLLALQPALGERAVGGGYGSAAILTLGGLDPRTGRPFVNYETIGGGMGASAAAPGLSGHRVHMGNTMNLPVESLEAAFPMQVLEYALIDGSGGAGRQSGGLGVRRSVRALADNLEFSLLCERRLRPAHGAMGGGPGAPARFTLRRDGGEEALPSKVAPRRLDTGDEVVVETAGGGGWGEPR
jgi:N-methylhydantoinase B